VRILLILLGVVAHFAVAVRNGPGMASVITRGGTVVRIDATGHDARGAPITADTPMRVASLSKSFTAAAVLALVDAGKVELDRPIGLYLPEFRMADPRASAITVRQLLNQTSGLSDRTIDIDATQRAATLREYVAALANARLAATPGTHWEYCNVNYDVAARLVEVVDGRPFAEAMRQLVFGPLGMTHSSIAAPDRGKGTGPADGYVSVFGVWVARPELPGFRGGAGGVVTTAADMGRWLISQTGNGPQILSAASRRAMQTPGPAAGGYAMGWGVEHAAGRTLLVHAGNLFTYTAVQAIDPATGEGWAVLANSASLVDPTYDELLALVGGTEPPRDRRLLVEGILGGIALIAVGLGLSGVRRARRPRRPWRLFPPLIPVAVFATYPQWTSLLMNGRRVTWAQMTYFPAPLTITLGIAALAGLVTLIARLRWMGSSR
jgi:CubicO group peptidase (beta-lactamase class C family)